MGALHEPFKLRGILIRFALTWMVGWLLFNICTATLCRFGCQGQVTSCESNVKNIGSALETYASDHGGQLPTGLNQLIPDYLKLIPTCPSAGYDTYSESYVHSGHGDYVVGCHGWNHRYVRLPPGYPEYTSNHGLVIGQPDEFMTPLLVEIYLSPAFVAPTTFQAITGLLFLWWLAWLLAGRLLYGLNPLVEGFVIVLLIGGLTPHEWREIPPATGELFNLAWLALSPVIAGAWVGWRSRGRLAVAFAAGWFVYLGLFLFPQIQTVPGLQGLILPYVLIPVYMGLAVWMGAHWAGRWRRSTEM